MADAGRQKRKSKKSRAKKESGGGGYLVEALLAVVFLLIVALIWSLVSYKQVDQGETNITASLDEEIERPDQIFEEEVTGVIAPNEAVTLTPLKKVKPKPSKKQKKYSGAPSVAIIIDDLGADTGIVDALFALNIPLAFSILPHLKYSRSVALNARKMGQVVMLHIPMEPKSDSNDPGQGALFVDFENFLIVKRFEESLASTVGIEGVNNHMGSRFTQSESKMRVVLEEIKKRGLFFVDSRTTADTVAYKMALSMGIPTAERSVFLDNDREVEKISLQILELARKALDAGSAIGIGHPYPETVEAMEKTIPQLESMGVRIVPVTAILSGEGGQ